MIIDQLNHAAFYFSLSDRIGRALFYLQKRNLASLAIGKYSLDGERIFALVEEFKTKPAEKGAWEAHRKYLDIHCVLQGAEKIGYAPIKAMHSSVAYDAEKDIEFFQGSGDFLIAAPGSFVIMLPQDVHMPGLAVQKPEWVRKLVMKVETEA